MSRAISLLIGTLVAAVVIGLAAPSLASRAEQRLRASIPFMQADSEAPCRSIDPGLIQFDAELDGGQTPGRVTVLDDGTLAVLIVANDVNDEGQAVAVDFAASLRISAIILASNGQSDRRVFDPPVRNGANLRAPEGSTIERVIFCYEVSFPAPPQAQDPGATVEAAPTESVAPTATELTLDVSAEETAAAESARIIATATAAAEQAAAEVSAAETRAAGIAASATAAADSAQATVAAQQTAIASAEAEAAAAEATLAALQATIAAPTITPKPTLTPEPTATPEPVPTETAAPATAVAYETDDDEPFAGWDLPDGWSIENGLLVTDGGSSGSWIVVPAPGSIGTDVAVEIEVRVTGGELCPRNFGVGVRMSEAGYQAGGIEWACAPEAVFWSDGAPVSKHSLPDSINLNEGLHTLRVTANGDQLTIAIDGAVVASEAISTESDGRLIAMWSDNVPLEIRRVTVFEAGS